jgi:hypothetical protein
MSLMNAEVSPALFRARATMPRRRSERPSRRLRRVKSREQYLACLLVGTLDDLVKASRSGKALNVGSSGAGTQSHLALAQFQRRIGGKATHIPYKGGAPSLVDLMGGQLDAVFGTISEA